MNPLITHADMLSPYGDGTAACYEGLLAGRSAIRATDGFNAARFVSDQAALVPELAPDGRSRLMGMLGPLLRRMAPAVPTDAAVLLATTTGEVELLDGGADAEASRPAKLLPVVRELTGAQGPAAVVSAACISSAAALARAGEMMRAGRIEAALVVGCDAVSELVFSGFSTLMALSPRPARPFDRDRDGLTLGEGVAGVVLISPERARREGRPALARLLGWGLSADANHMTGPSRDGGGLALAIRAALRSAGLAPGRIGSICAHGTGTVYNDAMEMKALRRVFGEARLPVYSVKGGTGHTMGTAGLLEALVAAHALAEGVAPPTVGLEAPDDDAAGWVSLGPRELPPDAPALSVNAGFGGVNSAVIIAGAGEVTDGA